MSYHKFLEYVQNGIQKIMGESASVKIMQVEKNNGVKLDGLIIHDEGKNLSPTIYLNSFYEEYLAGKAKADILNEIYQTYHKCVHEVAVDEAFFLDYGRIHRHITFKLVNYEKNKDFLEQVPYVRFLDLAIVFVVKLPDCEQWKMEHATFMIKEEHLRMWNVDIGDVYRDALYHTPKLLPARIQGMETMLIGMIAEKLSACSEDSEELKLLQGELDELKKQEQQFMYVLTNTDGIHGAACMLYPDVLQEFAREKETDFYVLPSSVHEVLLVPAHEGVLPQHLKETVLEVNEKELETEEILSDSVYYYNCETDMLSVAGE